MSLDMAGRFFDRPVTLADLAAIDAVLSRPSAPAGAGLSALCAGAGACPDVLRKTGSAGIRHPLWLARGMQRCIVGAGGWTRHCVTGAGRVRQGTGRAQMDRMLVQARGGGLEWRDTLTTRTARPFYAARGGGSGARLRRRRIQGSSWRQSACSGGRRAPPRKQKGPVFRPALCVHVRSARITRGCP